MRLARLQLQRRQRGHAGDHADDRRCDWKHRRHRARLQGLFALADVELDGETEYIVDASDSADSFLYTWPEFALAPTDWSRFGLAVQRTKVYQTEFDIQRGFFPGISYKRVDVTASSSTRM